MMTLPRPKQLAGSIALLCLFLLIERNALGADRVQEVDPLNFHVQLDSTLSTDLIPAITALLASAGSPLQLGNSFDARYGQHEEAFSKLTLGLNDIPLQFGGGLFRKLYIEAKLEFAFSGILQNPVLSQLNGKLEGLAYFNMGVTGTLPATQIKTSIGLLAGAGMGKRSDLISPDLLFTNAPVNESLKMYGVALSLSGSSDPENVLKITTSVDYRGSLFYSTLGEITAVHRWKIFTTLLNTDWTEKNALNFTPHFIIGAQPLPVDFLPRIWDFINPGAAIQSFTNYFGLGTEIRPPGSVGRNFNAFLGYYGGQVGCSLAYDTLAFLFKVGTWGVTLGPNTLVNSERLWEFSLGARF